MSNSRTGVSLHPSPFHVRHSHFLVQTYLYMAPEVITGNAYDERADCYSLGIVAFEMLSGFHPFAGQSEAQLEESHQCYSVYDHPDYDRDPDMADIIEDLMHRDVSMILVCHQDLPPNLFFPYLIDVSPSMGSSTTLHS